MFGPIERARRAAEERAADLGDELRHQSGQAGRFADRGETSFWTRGQDMEGLAGQLGRLARGEDSYSAEQLRQSLGQTLAAQQSMAAGARPGNAAMAARNAALNMSRQQSGLAGQQALAGIAERQAAAQSLGNMLGQMRGQDLQAALGGRGQAIGGYGDFEGNQTARYTAKSGQPTDTDKLLSAAQAIGTIAAVASDERDKVRTTRGGGRQFLDALRDYRYEYRNPRAAGAAPGRHVGVMAQDLERSPVGARAVRVAPGGRRMVDTARLAHALAAGAADLNKRVGKLEDRARG